ncbi:MAG: GNAT family N-acetyltransferase [Pseudomonadota bacterium]
MTGNDINIQQGFGDELRAAAAELYDAAFGAKLGVAIPDAATRKKILARGFDPAHAIVAMIDGDIVGIAGFQTAQGALTGNISIALLRRHLGLRGLTRALPVLALFERKHTAGELLMDGIGVSPAMRGKGVGTQLLKAVIAFAKAEGYSTVRLDVIDTNDNAKRLYERVGFEPVRTEQFGYLRWLLGFGASTQMAYRITDTKEERTRP